jgi:hypothetical protein
MRTTLKISTLSLALLLALALTATPVFAQVNATIQVNNARQLGLHPSGQLLMFTPDPVQPGSSVSHWDPIATPNLLMEPAINADLGFLQLDLTTPQLQDIGWSTGNIPQINIIPWLNGPGQGFDDQTPFGGAPGNPATTLGEARQNLMEAVLGQWANTLDSDVELDVLVTWVPLFCDPNAGAALAGALPLFIFRDDAALPEAGTWYPAALAEALASENLTGAPDPDPNNPVADILVFVNSAIDEGCLGAGTGYYYGLDGNNPGNQIDLAPVSLHEVGHGLGFSTTTDDETGQQFGISQENPLGFPNIYDNFLFDQVQGKHWNQMTESERVQSAVNFRQLTWSGANANADAAPLLSNGVPELAITAPPSVAGSYEINTAAFGPPVPGGGLTGQIACLRDGVVDANAGDLTFLNGCTEATNPAQLAGKIALIDRGACGFTTKVANAQAAGAIGAIIVNNAGNAPPGLGGNDPSITIPAISVGRRDGNRIREAACPDAAAFLGDGERFQITTSFNTGSETGAGKAVQLTDDTTYFWFFNPENVEMIVKVLDACDVPGFDSFWVFAGGLTNVEVNLTVVDTQTGSSKVYTNPLSTPFQPIQDTQAFLTCP